MSTKGYLAIVLHAHLPFVRHPEHPRAMEERWLFEALAECYLPLLGAFERLHRGGIPFALDDVAHAASRGDAARRSVAPTAFTNTSSESSGSPNKETAASAGRRRAFVRSRSSTWSTSSRCGAHGSVSAATWWGRWWHTPTPTRSSSFRAAATHAYLPGLLPTRRALRAQLRLGMRAFEHSHRATAARHLAARVRLLHPSSTPRSRRRDSATRSSTPMASTFARPRPPFGVHAPIASPTRVSRFSGAMPSRASKCGRGKRATRATSYYRDFYRDVGFDLPAEYLGKRSVPLDARTMTGLKYYRITGATDDKAPYQPGVGPRARGEHAGNFLHNRDRANRRYRHAISRCRPSSWRPTTPSSSVIGGSRGPAFSRASSVSSHKATAPARHAPGDHAARLPRAPPGDDARHARPLRRGVRAATARCGSVPNRRKVWRHVHHASRYVAWLLDRHRGAEGERGRALDQTIRELLAAAVERLGLHHDHQDGRHPTRGRACAPTCIACVTSATWCRSRASTDATWRFIEERRISRDNFLADMPSESLRSAYD